MFSNLSISLLFAVGSGAWIYVKMMRYSGNNRKNSIIVTAVAGVIIAVILTTVLDMVFKKH